MPRYTITPWRHQRDLLEVRTQLYPQHTTADPSTGAAAMPQQQAVQDMRRHAVDRILAWKLRGNLPHAVESTALLVDAILHHHQQQQQAQPQPPTSPNTATTTNAPTHPTPASTFALRAVYSAAFTRFVTGFCDIGRSRAGGLTPASMLEIARQIEMPASFVGLRHEATHEELPALGRLVGASAEALEWFRELGSAMGPAITLWSGLLDLLATTIADFRLTLIRHALSVLSSADAASANADQDADAEGLYLWTCHFLDSEGERGAVLALRWCCLYPGYWTGKLGHDILARSDEEFVHVWKGLFESSALRDADPVASEAVPSECQQEIEMNGFQDGVRGDSRVLSSNELGSGGWRRAVVPPSVPIGVVA
ncbi:hypothetical protein KC355_g2775 [Hortaea werneckii]|nr:hypothetical protein KC355_g2775 [Hortaea werneckii]